MKPIKTEKYGKIQHSKTFFEAMFLAALST